MERIGLAKGQILISQETSIWKILQILATKGPLNVKAIKEETDLDYAYCHKRVKLMERLNLVGVAEKREGPKGRELNFYDLTLKGLVYYLAMSRFQYLEKITKKYKKLLPHVFGEWEYFRSKDLEAFLKKRFKKTIDRDFFEDQEHQKFLSSMTSFNLKVLFEDFYRRQIPFEEVKERIELNTLVPWLIYVRLGFWPTKKSGVYSEEFQKAIRQNPKLWAYLKPIIVEERKQTEKLLAKLNEVLS